MNYLARGRHLGNWIKNPQWIVGRITDDETEDSCRPAVPITLAKCRRRDRKRNSCVIMTAWARMG